MITLSALPGSGLQPNKGIFFRQSSSYFMARKVMGIENFLLNPKVQKFVAFQSLIQRHENNFYTFTQLNNRKIKNTTFKIWSIKLVRVKRNQLHEVYQIRDN